MSRTNFGGFILFPSLPFSSELRVPGGQFLFLLESEAKKEFNTSAFSSSFVTEFCSIQ